ncbi:hypothetical protein [Streptomyces sp. AC555_RSS877]|uniref:hypothetical protein n=1 Tax=Streptomyces sp. AC555_RSS877 TaxID=2823688 RepID=UPI001C27CFD6|nr:hypothetical protein [Streptomyces sp. AC555_RSS877]
MLFFQSVPDRPRGLVPGMYTDGGLRDVLSNQDTLRGTHACNWSSDYTRPAPREGGVLLADAPRRGLLVESDGAVTGAVSATAEMLGWAMERYNDGSGVRRINVFVRTHLPDGVVPSGAPSSRTGHRTELPRSCAQYPIFRTYPKPLGS